MEDTNTEETKLININDELFLNKYQPKQINQLQLDDTTYNLLKTLCQIDSLNILFIGDTGSGKTTILNAIITEYYNTNTNTNTNEPNDKYKENILHINSLKEQGINYYRNEVKTFCQTVSTIKHKKKVVVLDDIDIINEQSQQVFRNYIDKYSHNVHFICSCTNSQKVIESLQSRLLIIKINALTYTQLKTIMTNIILKEQLVIDDDAREFILNISNNNAKILVNYMEKIKLLNKPINYQLVNTICSNISFTIFSSYTQCLLKKDIQTAIHILYSIYDRGYSVIDILDNYFIFVKTTNLFSEEQKYIIIPIICNYITFFYNIHENEIELALFSNNILSKL